MIENDCASDQHATLSGRPWSSFVESFNEAFELKAHAHVNSRGHLCLHIGKRDAEFTEDGRLVGSGTLFFDLPDDSSEG